MLTNKKNNTEKFFKHYFTANIKNRMDGKAIINCKLLIGSLSRKLTIDFKEEGFTQDDIIKYITQIVRTEVDYQFNNTSPYSNCTSDVKWVN